MRFEFDSVKESANMTKHGVDFSTALRVFEPRLSMINHNRKGGAFEIEQPKVGQKGEASGSERVKGH
jgi:uncharacterized DUF497 family protein